MDLENTKALRVSKSPTLALELTATLEANSKSANCRKVPSTYDPSLRSVPVKTNKGVPEFQDGAGFRRMPACVFSLIRDSAVRSGMKIWKILKIGMV